MPNVVMDGKTIRLGKREFLGSGGEADVYKHKGLALKVWKGPKHADLAGDAAGQSAARQRLQLQQTKLPAFPKGLPETVVVPQKLLHNTKGQIVGYAMRFIDGADELIRFGQRKWRLGSGLDNNTVMQVFADKHRTLSALHQVHVTIGDYNDLNVMIDQLAKRPAHFIDMDSAQFGKFLCMAYTAKFLDPRHAKGNAMQLDEPHDAGSDWYAFYIMLMQSLLYVGPYGGVYMPKAKTNRVPESQRPLHHITVFQNDVRYPKKGIPLAALSDDLRHELEQFFAGDARGPFPENLLEWPRWTRCAACGIEHQHSACPGCAVAAPVQQRPIQVVSGGLTVTEVFKTTGHVVTATFQHGRICWVAEENGKLWREEKHELCDALRNPKARVRIHKLGTYIGANRRLILLPPDNKAQVLAITNDPDGLPCFDTNEAGCIRVDGNNLERVQPSRIGRGVETKHIGNVLGEHTRMWVGPEFGFGFYRASEMVKAFTFSATTAGVNDQIEIPAIRERLLGMRAYFTDKLCWILYVYKKGADLYRSCTVITSNEVVAHMTVKEGDGDAQGLGWLDMSIHGKCAVGRSLFIATDDGLARVDLRRHDAQLVKSFPDTEPWVSEGTELFVAAGGVAAVNEKTIHLLEMK